MELRPLTPADHEALWTLFRDDVIAPGETYVDDETTTRDGFVASWIGRGGEQWVAVDGAQLLGVYTVRPNQAGRGAHVGTASYIVAAAARGRGVGRALGTHSLARAAALGFAAVQFNFVVATNVAAVRLWQELGFAIVATLPRVFRHARLGLVDAHVMFRQLGPVATSPRYAHTNLIAHDWRRLAAFYVDVFACVALTPERDLRGDWLERGTGVAGAHICGVHLRLPGHGPNGPTLEVFGYDEVIPCVAPTPNRAGLGHLAFVVDDVAAVLARVIAAGGRGHGEVVSAGTAAGQLTFTYVRDPEGNLIELQRWNP